jgi:DNA mismatch repair protein MSH5
MSTGPQFKLPPHSKNRHWPSSARRQTSSQRSFASSMRSLSSVRSHPAKPRVRKFTSHQSGGSTPVPAQISSSPSQEEQAQESDLNDDMLTEVVMAVDLQHRDTVGCCYYAAREEKLYVMEDMVSGGVDVVDACRLWKLSCAPRS